MISPTQGLAIVTVLGRSSESRIVISTSTGVPRYDIGSTFLESMLTCLSYCSYFRTYSKCGRDWMDVADAVGALAALAHETRLAIHRMLVEAGPNGLPAGVIAERLGIPPSSLTFHLQQLFRARLATQRRASRQLIYAADFGRMNGLVGYLTENCCGRGEQSAPACDPACAPSIQAASGRTRRETA